MAGVSSGRVSRERNDLIHEGIATILRALPVVSSGDFERNDLIHEGIATYDSPLPQKFDECERNDLIHEGIATCSVVR